MLAEKIKITFLLWKLQSKTNALFSEISRIFDFFFLHILAIFEFFRNVIIMLIKFKIVIIKRLLNNVILKILEKISDLRIVIMKFYIFIFENEIEIVV